MIGHLADLLIHTSAANFKGKKDNDISQLVNENKTLRDALAKASPDIAHKFERGEFLTPKELKQMVENHLDRHVEIGAINDLEFKPGYPTGVNATVIDENATEDHVDKTETINEQPKKKVNIKL